MIRRGGWAFWFPASWREAPSPLAADEKGRVYKVPGVWAEGDFLYVPANAASVVAKYIRATGREPYAKQQPPLLIKRGKSAVLNELALQFLANTPYQRQAVDFGKDKEGVLINATPGSGKSLMAVASAAHAGLPCAIITGAKGRLKLASEVYKFTGRDAFILRGTGEGREIVRYDAKRGKVVTGYDPRALNELAKESGFVITGWQTLHAWADPLKALKPVKLVLDEIHLAQGRKRAELTEEWDQCVACNAKVERVYREEREEFGYTDGSGKEHDGMDHPVERKTKFEKLENITASASIVARASGSRYATDGTPVPDRPRGLWSPLDLLEPWQWGSSSYWFGHAYCGSLARMDGGDDRGSSRLDELAERMDHVMLKIPYDVTHRDLPPLRVETLRLTPDEMTKPIGAWAGEMKKVRRDDEKLIEVLLERAASRKAPKVVELVSEAVAAGQKCVVFSARRNDVDRLGAILRKELPAGTALWAAHGDTPESQRFHIAEREYMPHPGPAVLVGTGYAFGEQIDLHDTDLAIIAMLPWRPGDLVQWLLRFQRQGMKRACRLYFLVAEGDVADERVARILLDKVPAIVRLTGDAFAQQMAEALEGVRGHERELLDGLADRLIAGFA